MVSFNIKGIAAPVFTPFDDDGNVNLEVIPSYVDYLVANDVKAILVGGTTGEAVTLSLIERKAVIAAWLKAAKPAKVSVIVQVGGVPLPDVLSLAKFAEEQQADAIMSLPELYYKPRTVAQLVSYLELVSQAAPSLPLVYYHFPMMSGVDVNMTEFFSLASSKIPNFKGMKADLGVAVIVADQLAEDQRIFIANHMLAPSILLGHDSSIATVTNMFPSLVHSIYSAMKSGDVAKAKLLQEKLNKILTSISSQGDFVPTMKVAMELVTDIAVGPPRKPLTALEHKKKEAIEKNLIKLGVPLKRSV